MSFSHNSSVLIQTNNNQIESNNDFEFDFSLAHEQYLYCCWQCRY